MYSGLSINYEAFATEFRENEKCIHHKQFTGNENMSTNEYK